MTTYQFERSSSHPTNETIPFIASVLASSSNPARGSAPALEPDKQLHSFLRNAVFIDKSQPNIPSPLTSTIRQRSIVKCRFMIRTVPASLQRRIPRVAGVSTRAGAKTHQNLEYKKVVNFRDNIRDNVVMVVTMLSPLIVYRT